MKDWWDSKSIEERQQCTCLKSYSLSILELDWDDLEDFIKNSIVIRCA